MPKIDVTPIRVAQNPEGTHVATFLSVTNYSGFKAYDINIDMKYGDYEWIGEWIKADNHKNNKHLPQNNNSMIELYDLGLSFRMPMLKTGQQYEFPENGIDGKIGFSGSLNLEDEVCGKGKEGFPVSIRSRWKNEKGHVFEKISDYKLICTIVGNGRSFTMIPKSKDI